MLHINFSVWASACKPIHLFGALVHIHLSSILGSYFSNRACTTHHPIPFILTRSKKVLYRACTIIYRTPTVEPFYIP